MTSPNFERVTLRLRLCRPTLGDLDAAVAIHADGETYRFSPTGPMHAAQIAPMLREWVEHWACHGFGFWSIRRLDADEIIGFGGITRRPSSDGDEQQLVLYYRFRPTAWGVGYATEVAREALVEAFDLVHAPRVVTKIRRDNLRSIRVARKIGMRQGETFDDGGSASIRFCILNPQRSPSADAGL